MNVTIFGTGNMGRAIGHRLVAAGHQVSLRSTTIDKAQHLAEDLNKIGKGKATASPTDAAIADSVAVFAVPYATETQLARKLGAALAGKTVIDISNPLNDTFDGLVTGDGTSAGEEIAKLLPADARVVKAFNTTLAGTLVKGEVDGKKLDVFVAGDSEEAKQTVMDLVESAGMRPLNAGTLKRSRQLEAMALLNITMQNTHNFGGMSAWKLLV
jgi:8-hydroxy-5-deazaflavin:NADPH oxidoreductase